MSLRWNGNSYELKEHIASHNYKPSNSVALPLMDIVDSVCDNDDNDDNDGTFSNGIERIMKRSILPNSFLWKYSMKEYIDFFGPILKVKDKCSANAIAYIGYYSNPNGKSFYNSTFINNLSLLENSNDITEFRSFYDRYGPYVANEIDHGYSFTYSMYMTSQIGFNKISYERISIELNETQSSYKRALNNPQPVRFQPILLTNYLSKLGKSSQTVIETLKSFDTPIDYQFTNDLIKDAINTHSICESNNNLVVFGKCDHEIISDTTSTIESLSFFRNYYYLTKYQKVDYYHLYDSSIRNENNLFSFSLKKSLIFDMAMYGVTRQCQWPNPHRLEIFFTAIFIYDDMQKKENFNINRIPLGYCSSTKHPNMVPLYRFFNQDSGLHFYSLEQFNSEYTLQSLECYVYPVRLDLDDNICLEK